MNILVIVAHPNREEGLLNTLLVNAFKKEGVTIHELYKVYPEGIFDVQKEQELLASHDKIVLEFPMYWYAAPYLLHKWIEDVFEHGILYGSSGRLLEGKTLQVLTTTGASKAAFSKDGRIAETVEDLYKPFYLISKLCHMNYLPPEVLYSTEDILDELSKDQSNSYSEEAQKLVRKIVKGEVT